MRLDEEGCEVEQGAKGWPGLGAGCVVLGMWRVP